jgi:hypothetical protein
MHCAGGWNLAKSVSGKGFVIALETGVKDFLLQRTTLDLFKSNRIFSQSSLCAVLAG